jgi:transporter family-2 protein
VYLAIAGAAGAAMAIQGTINAALGKVIGVWESTFVVHVVGAVIIAVLLFGFRIGQGNWQLLPEAPWYNYVGGALNVLIIFGVVYCIPKVGVGNATAAIVTLQILTAVAIDHFGVFGMEKITCHWSDLVGVVLLGVGAKILLR